MITSTCARRIVSTDVVVSLVGLALLVVWEASADFTHR